MTQNGMPQAAGNRIPQEPENRVPQAPVTGVPQAPDVRADAGQRAWIIAVIALMVLLAAVPRVLSWHTGTGRAADGSLRPGNPDAYYYLRMTEVRAGEGSGIVRTDRGLVDTMRYAPEGFAMDGDPQLISALTVLLYRLLRALAGCSVYAVANGMTMFLPGLAAIPALLLLILMLRDTGLWRAHPLRIFIPSAAVTGISAGLNASFLSRTLSGYYDTDILIPFFAALLLYFLYRAETGRQPLASAAALLVTEGLFSRWWAGHIFFAGIAAVIAMAALIASLLTARNKADTDETAPDPQKSGELRRHIAVLLALPAGVLVFGGAGQVLDSVRRVGTMFRLSAETSHRAGESWFPNVYASIQERAGAVLAEGFPAGLFQTSPYGGGSAGLINSLGGILICAAAMAGLVFLAVRAVRACIRRQEAGHALFPFLFLFIWTGASVVASMQAIRYLMIAGVPVGISAGLFTAGVLDRLRGRRTAVQAVSAVILCAALTFPLLYGAWETGRDYRPPVISDDMADAAEFIRTRTPQDAVIATWWDHGYYYGEAAQRATLFDGGTQTGIRSFWTARALVTDDPALCDGIWRMLCGAGDSATEWLLERTGSGADAVRILLRALPLEPGEAGKFYTSECGLTEDEADELLALSHPERRENAVFALSSDMAGLADLFAHYGYWQEESRDRRIYVSMEGIEAGRLPDTDEARFLVSKGTSGDLVLEISGSAADGGITAALHWENGKDTQEGGGDMPYRLRYIWYGDGSRAGGAAARESAGSAAGEGGADDGALLCDLVVIGPPGEEKITLLSASLSDTLIGDLYYRKGLWQDRYALIRAAGDPPGGITVSLWEMR